MTEDRITPIRKQYLDVKRQYPDAIVFFRLGDFYETFDQDAEITSRELDIVLTSRNIAKGVRVPMAGIPYHAVENYLSRLIDNGYHVAICEQVGEQPAKGIFSRQVVRVITPGTVSEPNLLPGDRNNYLLSYFYDGKNTIGLAYVDVSTGEFSAVEFRTDDFVNDLLTEINRLQPKEILHPESLKLSLLSGHQTSYPDWKFESGKTVEVVKDHFKVMSLEGFGLDTKPYAVRAIGGIIQYLSDTRTELLQLLKSIKIYSLSEFMNLDSATRRNLELLETIRGGDTKGSLLWVLDHTVTPMGKRLIRKWVSQPLLEVFEIQKRQEIVQLFCNDGLLRNELIGEFRKHPDLERLGNRIVGGIAIPRDLVSLRSSLAEMESILDILPTEETVLAGILERFQLCREEYELISRAITDDPPATLQSTGVIKEGYSSELDRILEESRHAREWIANLESTERQRTGINSLKVGYNKVFGYYIEVTKSKIDLVPGDYIRKQTLVNAERYITPEMKDYETKVLNADEEIKRVEARLFKKVCRELASSIVNILSTARVLAELDVYASLAEIAAHRGYCRPQVVEDDVLEIDGGKHPVVGLTLGQGKFVPNNTRFEEGERIQILTGPNMSGKSTYLRQVALITLMAQVGSFVPARSAKIGLVDRIFTRIGAQDEIHAGQSTFMVEMLETANILHNATNRSLVILDEIGRGTSTYDGVSIAWAVVEYIHNHPELKAKTLFATHYHELTQLADFLPGVRNYNVAVSESEGKVIFLHKIILGGADRSYGIHVGQLAGLPGSVIQRADEILHQLEESSGTAVKIDPNLPKQINLFPETNPLIDELKKLDINSLSPIEALNRLYEWKKRYLDSSE